MKTVLKAIPGFFARTQYADAPFELVEVIAWVGGDNARVFFTRPDGSIEVNHPSYLKRGILRADGSIEFKYNI